MVQIRARPRPVTVAIVLFGLSLLSRVYGELSLLIFLADPDQPAGYTLGRAIVPLGFYAIQAWALWSVAHGKNWARITLVVLVLLNTAVATLVLATPMGQAMVSTAVTSIQVVAELVAVVLLLWATEFFVQPAKVNDPVPRETTSD